MGNKNKIHVISDSDNNLGEGIADEINGIVECKRQLYDINTYITLSVEEMEILIAKIKSDLTDVVHRFKIANICNEKEKNYLLSKTNVLLSHIFISFGKFWKIPSLGDQL